MVLKDVADTTHCVKPLSPLDFRGCAFLLLNDAATSLTDGWQENSIFARVEQIETPPEAPSFARKKSSSSSPSLNPDFAVGAVT
jgi:hypothetical protein